MLPSPITAYLPLENDALHEDKAEEEEAMTAPDPESIPLASRQNDEKKALKRCKYRTLFLSIAAMLIILLALWGAADIVRALWPSSPSASSSQRHRQHQHQGHNQSPLLPCYCGSTLEEAQALHCEYVPMASAWLPPHCRDPAIEGEFDTLGPNPDGTWNYFADSNMSEPLSRGQVAELVRSDGRYYTSWEWHVVHCLFYWRKLHRAQFSEVTMEPRFNTDGHIHHCSKLILRGGRGGVTISGIDMGDEFVSDKRQRLPTQWDDLRTDDDGGYDDHNDESDGS
ncbi:hypothetical protein E4U13_007690 [Claviceps humidiphila]|uniref:Uncharacterized protein n=1 Tax=Claviceps humidiphila TaxID=1294629 RepID=A0A9P7Q5J1_9HYPO|nr:hypothetical protein E4U13_007690 [Claviceps humidiphila]